MRNIPPSMASSKLVTSRVAAYELFMLWSTPQIITAIKIQIAATNNRIIQELQAYHNVGLHILLQIVFYCTVEKEAVAIPQVKHSLGRIDGYSG